MGGGRGKGGGGGANFSLAVNWSEPPPHSVPNNYISHIKNFKTDSIANLRIQLKSLLLEMRSNKIKGTYIKFVHLSSSFTVSHRH